jgi:hypothetical protein
LDQMFSMLRNWGEGHTAFGQTAQVQRTAARRKSRAEGRKADSKRRSTRAAAVVLDSKIEPGIARKPWDQPVVPNGQSSPEDATSADHRA